MHALATALVSQLRATHTGQPWYGRSLEALLEHVGPTDAAEVVLPGNHSVWQLVLHLTSWNREALRRLNGSSPAEPEDGDWPAVGEPTAARWEAARQRLGAAHAALIAAIEALPDEQWTTRIGEQRDAVGDPGVNAAGMLIGLAQHDAYHIGQIASNVRALEEKSP